jgi:hypothetical protein
MKLTVATFFVFLAISVMSGCSNDDTTTNGGGIVPGGGGTAAISYTISGTRDQTNYTFNAAPSVDTKISKVIASLPGQNFSDTITADPTVTFTGGTVYEISTYTGVDAGQAWVFTFTGTIVSSNQAYTVTSNFTVPN